MTCASSARRLILASSLAMSFNAVASESPETTSSSTSAIEPPCPPPKTPVSAQLTCQYEVTSVATFEEAECTQEILGTWMIECKNIVVNKTGAAANFPEITPIDGGPACTISGTPETICQMTPEEVSVPSIRFLGENRGLGTCAERCQELLDLHFKPVVGEPVSKSATCCR